MIIIWGRFLSVDPFIQEVGNSQSMNPYSYIMNNPLAGTDPSGYLAKTGRGGSGLGSTWMTYTGGKFEINNGIESTKRITGDPNYVRTEGINLKRQGYRQTLARSNEDGTETVEYTKFFSGGTLLTFLLGHERGMMRLDRKDLKPRRKGVETKFYMDDHGKVLHKTQDHCYGDDKCRIYYSEIPAGTSLIGHTHEKPKLNKVSSIRSREDRAREMSRDIPGQGDASPLKFDMVSGVITVNGYKYIIDGTIDNPQVHYLGGGDDPEFGRFVEQYWKPNDEKYISETMGLIYLRLQDEKKEKLKMEGRK